MDQLLTSVSQPISHEESKTNRISNFCHKWLGYAKGQIVAGKRGDSAGPGHQLDDKEGLWRSSHIPSKVVANGVALSDKKWPDKLFPENTVPLK